VILSSEEIDEVISYGYAFSVYFESVVKLYGNPKRVLNMMKQFEMQKRLPMIQLNAKENGNSLMV